MDTSKASKYVGKVLLKKYASRFGQKDWEDFKKDIGVIMVEGCRKGRTDERKRINAPKA